MYLWSYKENTIMFIPLLCIATRAICIDIDALSPFYNDSTKLAIAILFFSFVPAKIL